MHITLRRGVREYQVVSRHQLMQFHSHSSARAFLETFFDDPSDQWSLREAVGGQEGIPTSGTSDDEHGLLDRVAGKLAQGELSIVAMSNRLGQPFSTVRREKQEEYRIVSRRQVMRFRDRASARSFLQPFVADPANRPSLREALGGHRVIRRPSSRGDNELLDQLASQLVRGEPTIVAIPKRLAPQFATPLSQASEDRAMTPREAEQAARAEGPAPRPLRSRAAPPTPATLAKVDGVLLPLLVEVQIAGAKVLPEVLQTLEQIDLTMGSLDLAGISLEPTPSGVAAISEGMQQASASVTATLDGF